LPEQDTRIQKAERSKELSSCYTMPYQTFSLPLPNPSLAVRLCFPETWEQNKRKPAERCGNVPEGEYLYKKVRKRHIKTSPPPSSASSAKDSSALWEKVPPASSAKDSSALWEKVPPASSAKDSPALWEKVPSASSAKDLS
jgi:hypothetical protein